jgi:hypothetical protein
VDTATYSARVGPYLPEITNKRVLEKDQREGETWVLAIKRTVQLVTGGVQNNPGPTVRQEKTDQLQSHKKTKSKHNFSEGHNHEISDMEKRITDFEIKLEVIHRAM